MLSEAIATKVGGRSTRDDEEATAERGISHNENSTNAMSFASDVWRCKVSAGDKARQSVHMANLKEIFAAARASQRAGHRKHKLLLVFL